MALELDITCALRSFAVNLSLSVAAGETVALAGPSGAGKTTVLRAIAGLRRPDRGHISSGDATWFDANNAIDLAPERRSVGYVPQEGALFTHLDVTRNIAFAGASPAQIVDLLARLAIGHLAHANPATLSGGERQRVALARALARNPSVMLLDEPLSALDAYTRGVVRDELRDVLHGLGLPVVFVTHDRADAAALADRIAVVVDGEIRQDAPLATLVRDPADPFVVAFCGGQVLPDGRAVFPWSLKLTATGDGLPGRVVSLVDEGARVRVRVLLDTGIEVAAELSPLEAAALSPGMAAFATVPADAPTLT